MNRCPVKRSSGGLEPRAQPLDVPLRTVLHRLGPVPQFVEEKKSEETSRAAPS
jgi:hypothetical protein